MENSQEKLRRMELGISLILRGGVIISATFIGLGVFLFIITGKTGYAVDQATTQSVSAYTIYEGEKNAGLYFPTNPADILAGAFSLKSFGVIALGLLLLILTPILRVLVSVVTFALQKDWLYVGFTLFVLVVLLTSFFLGKAGG